MKHPQISTVNRGHIRAEQAKKRRNKQQNFSFDRQHQLLAK